MKKVLVVGIGPGEYEQMTIRAASALREAQVIVGYTVYVDLVREHFPGKRFLTTPMTQEAEDGSARKSITRPFRRPWRIRRWL